MPDPSLSKPFILFVDDDPLVLQGLCRMLHPMRDAWQVDFCEGGPEALARIKASLLHYDVVVSDMRMPVMNGAELLSQIAALYPGTVRVILSGHADRQMVMQSVGVAHRYLSKPCDARLLVATLQQAIGLRTLLKNEEVRRTAAGTTSLPSRPDLYVRMLAVIQESDSAIEQIEEIVSHDPAMAGKVLKLVNSAFFGIPTATRSLNLKEAISYLGLDVLRSLILTLGLFKQLKESPDSLPASEIEALWNHSFEVAEVARAIAEAEEADRSIVEEAFIGGLLHDVGKLLLAAGKKEPLVCRDQELPSDAERRLHGATHGEAGGYLFALWGLSAGIIETVAFHHEPRRGATDFYGTGGLTPLTAVHAADVLVHGKNKDASHPSLYLPDEEHLSRIGLLSRWPVWEKLI